MSVAVLRTGLLTTLQDRGRNGYAALGVGHAGPMDEVAHRLANALVGNPDDAATLEITLLGPRLRCDADAVVALTGADFEAHLDGAPLPAWRPLPVPAGSVLDIGRAHRGARGYLALAGGFHGTWLLGSAATDVNARIGTPLRTGDRLEIEDQTLARRRFDADRRGHRRAWSLDPRPWFDPNPAKPLRMIRGRHYEALDRASQAALFGAEFRVAADSNRVGYRLDGASLELAAPLEIVSEPLAFGTVQLPAGGQPIALMAEHPVTGGYPRIGQVAAVDLPRLAQCRPGASLRFEEIGMETAQTRYLRREHELARLFEAIAGRLE